MRDYKKVATRARVPETERHWLRVLGALNEAQARLFVAQQALPEERGAISRPARLTGMPRPAILKGIAELAQGRVPTHANAGRKRVEQTDPQLKRVLARLVEASTAGDPMS